jgi:hypothetical protein
MIGNARTLNRLPPGVKSVGSTDDRSMLGAASDDLAEEDDERLFLRQGFFLFACHAASLVRDTRRPPRLLPTMLFG